MKIRLGTDLDELVSLRPDRTMTTWDPAFFPGGEAFWLHGIGDLDQTAFVIAGRLFEVCNLKIDIETLKVFYIHTETRQDLCSVVGQDFSFIRGRVIHTGNLWVAPAFRGQGLAGFATRKLHREILRRWPEAQWIWGLQEKELAYKGLWQDQLYSHCEGDVTWSGNPYAREFRMKIVYSSREEMEQALAKHASRFGGP